MACKVLLVSGLQIFPPISGGQLRTASLAMALGELGNKVDIYSFTGRRENYLKFHSSSSNEICKNVSEHVKISPLFGLLQFLSYKLGIPPLWQTIVARLFIPQRLKKMALEHDHVIIDFPFLYPLGTKLKAPFTLSTHNVESMLWKSKGPWGKVLSSMVSLVERNAVTKCQRAIFCTKQDKGHFDQEIANAGVSAEIVPNGLVHYEKLIEDRGNGRGALRKTLGITPETNLVLFSGSSYFANGKAFKFLKKFCADSSEVLEVLNIKFLIVGSVAKRPEVTSHYIATSQVPSVHKYFMACDAAINPVTVGSGCNVKMAEYMAYGLPTFTTDFGARGFELVDGESCWRFNEDNLLDVMANALSLKKMADRLAISKCALERNRHQIDMKFNLGNYNRFLQLETKNVH